jgi:hypothetical protein
MLSHATHELGEGWVFGLHEGMDQAGAVVGPLAMAAVLAFRGGAGSGAAYQTAFAVLFIPAAAGLLMLLPARLIFPNPAQLEPEAPSGPRSGWDRRRYRLYVLAAGLIGAGFADFALIAFHLHAAHLAPDAWIPLLFALAMGVQALTALVAGRLYDRQPTAALLVTFGLGALFAPSLFSARCHW